MSMVLGAITKSEAGGEDRKWGRAREGLFLPAQLLFPDEYVLKY